MSTEKNALDTGGPGEQLVEVPVRPPRDPSMYRPTDHFLHRLRERVPKHDRDILPERLLREGNVERRPGDPRADPDEKHDGAVVAFTTTVRKEPWTIVVALRPTAFLNESSKHRALSIYQGTPRSAGGEVDE